MRSAGRWIAVREAAGAARAESGMHAYASALASRPAAGMRVPVRFAGTTAPAVVASASGLSFAFA